MHHTFRQAYRHVIQQWIVQQEMRYRRQDRGQSAGWETGGISALFSAAAVCGIFAQAHLR